MNGADDKLIELKPAFGIRLRLWWGFIWRLLVGTIPLAILVTIITEVGGLSELSAARVVVEIIYFLAVLFLSIKVFGVLVGKVFGGYRLVMLTPQAGEAGASGPLISEKPPFGAVLGMWWGFHWRSFLWAIPFVVVVLILTVPLTMLSAALGLGPVGAIVFLGLVYFVGLVLISTKVFGQIMGKTFGGYRLVMLTPMTNVPTTLQDPPPPPRVSDSAHPDSV